VGVDIVDLIGADAGIRDGIQHDSMGTGAIFAAIAREDLIVAGRPYTTLMDLQSCLSADFFKDAQSHGEMTVSSTVRTVPGSISTLVCRSW
jgi:hypothetical protein